MNYLFKLGGAILAALGIFIASHTRDVAMLEGVTQAVVPGLAMLADMTVAAALTLRGWA